MRDISLYLSTIPDYNQMLAGKNVLITTAARGIGKSIALLFARQGADVYFGGRNEEYVRTTEKELQSIRPGCRGYVVDLAKADQTEAFVDAAVKDSGGFDILVSTVGVNCHCPAAEYKDEDMFRLLETNYLSGVRCARKVIPTMQARGGGCNLVRRTEKGRLRRRGWGLRWEKAQKGGKGTNLRGFFED